MIALRQNFHDHREAILEVTLGPKPRESESEATEVALETGEISRAADNIIGRVCGQVLVTTGLFPVKRTLNSVFYSDPTTVMRVYLSLSTKWSNSENFAFTSAPMYS